jgi:hypothetical protein
LNSQSAKSDRRFVIVMIFSFVLGMAVALALAVRFLWMSHAANLQPSVSAMALVVCPPFVLSYAIGATPDSAFALVLGVGTIIFANGCLYAGVAAGIYAVVTLLGKRRARVSPQRHRGHREE